MSTSLVEVLDGHRASADSLPPRRVGRCQFQRSRTALAPRIKTQALLFESTLRSASKSQVVFNGLTQVTIHPRFPVLGEIGPVLVV